MLKKTLLVLPLVVSLTVTHTAAQSPEACAAISDPNERLSCYDALYQKVETPQQVGAWRVQRTKSQLDDSERVVLSLESETPVRGRFGSPGPANMHIRCEENTTSIFFQFNELFMASIQSYGRVDYRIDSNPPAHINMRESTSNMALGLWRGNESIPFIRRLLGAGSLYVRATPYNESRVETTFNVSGLDDAIKPLRAACNW